MKFNSKKIWANVKEPAIVAAAGVGTNIVVDAALQSAEAIIPVSITSNPYYVNGGKLLLGAVLAATGNKWVQLAGTGLATVGASNLANAALDAIMPNAASNQSTSGVPFIGRPRRVRMGQRAFRNVRPAVHGTGKIGAVPFQAE